MLFQPLFSSRLLLSHLLFPNLHVIPAVVASPRVITSTNVAPPNLHVIPALVTPPRVITSTHVSSPTQSQNHLSQP